MKKREEWEMIKLKMASPMPNMLALTDNLYSLNKEILFRQGITMGDIMEALAEEHPKFKQLWEEKTCAALEKCLVAINGNVIESGSPKWDMKLEDGMEIKLFMPYAGG